MKKIILFLICTICLGIFISCESGSKKNVAKIESKAEMIERLAESGNKALDVENYEIALENYFEIKSIDTLYPK